MKYIRTFEAFLNEGLFPNKKVKHVKKTKEQVESEKNEDTNAKTAKKMNLAGHV